MKLLFLTGLALLALNSSAIAFDDTSSNKAGLACDELQQSDHSLVVADSSESSSASSGSASVAE